MGDPLHISTPTVTCPGDVRILVARQNALVCGVAVGGGWPFPRAAMLLGSREVIQHCVLWCPWSCASRDSGQGNPGGLPCYCFLVPMLPASRLAVKGPCSNPDPAASMFVHSWEAPSLVAEHTQRARGPGWTSRSWGSARRSPLLWRGGLGGSGTWTRKLWSLLPHLPPRPHPCLGSQAGNLIFSFVLGPG